VDSRCEFAERARAAYEGLIMKLLKALMVLLAPMLAATLDAAESEVRIKVLVVTGGHGFKREPFFKMFEENPRITFTEAKQGQTSEAYERDDLLTYDAVVLYDMVQNITAAQKAKFLSLFEKGTGLVVLHHALVSYQNWPEFERIVGGTYPEPADKKGVVTPELGYQHDVEIPAVIVAKDHPVTTGLQDFNLHDEIYWGFRVSPDVAPLLTTTHAKSGKPLAWTRTEKKSRIVYIQPGHGPEAHGDANYRRLVARAISWTAKR
jgi:uncharacterized protein